MEPLGLLQKMISIDSVALALPAIMEEVDRRYLQNGNNKYWIWPDEEWFNYSSYDVNMCRNTDLRMVKIYSFNHKLKRTNGTPILVINYDMFRYEILQLCAESER